MLVISGDTSKDTIYAWGANILESYQISLLKPKEKAVLIYGPLLIRYGLNSSAVHNVCDIRLEVQRGREKDMARRE